MKIVYLLNGRLPTEKAYGIQVAKMCEAFANSGQEVKLFYPYRKNPAIKQDIFSYYSIKNNFVSQIVESRDYYFPGFLDKISFLVKNYFSAKALIDKALKENADVYYTRDELVAYLLSKKNKNVIFECHRFSNKRKLFYSHFKKINLKIVAISDGLKKDLLNFGFSDANVLVARDGVDLEEFNLNLSKIDARKMFFSSLHNEAFGRKKIAVYIGGLYTWKGADVLVNVAEHLKEINVNYFVWIVGGSKNDVERLKRGLHPSIVPLIYFNGAVPHKEVAKILIAADCAVLTGNGDELISSKYTSPLKMFEYMASGCPIVAQNLPSFREVLSDENSFLAEPDNAKALADKINWVFENEELAKNKAEKAFEDVQEYTWQKRAEKILNFI